MVLSKKTSDQPTTGEAQAEGENPYLRARGAWIERYGSYVSQAYNWRLIAVLESIALITAIVGLVYIACQSKYVPYVVVVDKVGLALGVRPAERSGTIDDRVVHAELANFLANARGVVRDRVIEKANINAAYAMVPESTQAHGYLESWYPTHSPFERMRRGRVEVQVNAILPVSQNSYRIQWTETMSDLIGHVVGNETWEAEIGVAFHPPSDEAAILINPIGLYITSLNWVKKL